MVLFAVVQSQNPNAWFLAFAICPQCFHVTTVRLGMVFVVVFNVVAGALLAWRQPDLAGALTAVGIVTFAVGFSYVYTRWMERVIDQSLERAALIAQLESTRAELAAAHHEAGVLAERHRLAGEIHDTLAQGFTSIVTLIQAAALVLDPGQDAPRRHLDLALAAARENLAEARLLVTDLGPAALEQASLGDALQRVTGSTGAEAGIRAHAEITGTARPLPTGTEVILLRVCQEALANVRKHAGARQVTVRLCYADDTVRLAVTDDGAGFEPGALSGAMSGGFGLPGMRDRVQQAGGTLEVTSAPAPGLRSAPRYRDDVRQRRRPFRRRRWQPSRRRRRWQRPAAGDGAGPVIRVLLADDHPVVRAGLRGMLAAEPGIEVVGEAGSGPEAVALARAGSPTSS